jgi:nucleotidyltransferase AbiEii toxin of type IV toxin-antitoxin system
VTPISPCSSPTIGTPRRWFATSRRADLLFASSGIEPEVVAAADRIEVVPGFTVPVARLGHLIALKVLARDDRTRPQDRVDLAALLTQADAAALGEAREALTLVARRGFQRGRDLLAGLDAALNEFCE